MNFSDRELSSEQRQFLAYWQEQSGNQIAPRRQGFDVLHVPTLMSRVVIFDVLRNPLDFRYRLVGTVVREMSAREYTGMKLSEIEGRGPGSTIWSVLDEVRSSREPAFRSIPYIGPKKDFLKLNNLFLPWVDDNMETDMIVLVCDFVSK